MSLVGWWGWFEVVVLLGCLGGVEVGGGDECGCVVGGGDGPLFFVDEVVVVAAEQDAVGGGGWSAV